MAQDGMEKEEDTKMEEYDAAHMQAMHDRLDALEQAVMALAQPTEEVEMTEEVTEELSAQEEPKEELKEEPKEEVAPIAHSPEATDEKRATFYFPKN